jgi:2-methylisocitrate lyase-like PEP mutase family enzyme
MAAGTRAQAERLRALHHAATPLLLVNAWDAASARIAETLGFPAIATSSSGVANAEGFPDGGSIGRETMLARIAVIATAVGVPVSADLESGYGPTVEDATATARGAIAAGAVGLNFEDATGDAAHPLYDVALQVERIRALRAAGEGLGVPLVINARTDAMRHAAGDGEAKIAATIERGKAYAAAGADCIFVPFTNDAEAIGRLAKAIPAPINVLAVAGTPTVTELTALGVKRISLGGGPAAHALEMYRRAAIEARDHGTYSFLGARMTHPELSAMLTAR